MLLDLQTQIHHTFVDQLRIGLRVFHQFVRMAELQLALHVDSQISAHARTIRFDGYAHLGYLRRFKHCLKRWGNKPVKRFARSEKRDVKEGYSLLIR